MEEAKKYYKIIYNKYLEFIKQEGGSVFLGKNYDKNKVKIEYSLFYNNNDATRYKSLSKFVKRKIINAQKKTTDTLDDDEWLGELHNEVHDSEDMGEIIIGVEDKKKYADIFKAFDEQKKNILIIDPNEQIRNRCEVIIKKKR